MYSIYYILESSLCHWYSSITAHRFMSMAIAYHTCAHSCQMPPTRCIPFTSSSLSHTWPMKDNMWNGAIHSQRRGRLESDEIHRPLQWHVVVCAISKSNKNLRTNTTADVFSPWMWWIYRRIVDIDGHECMYVGMACAPQACAPPIFVANVNYSDSDDICIILGCRAYDGWNERWRLS